MMREQAAAGRFALQRCRACATTRYPPRECCPACLSDQTEWVVAETHAGTLLARTVLHHGNEPRFRPSLPLGVGLVRLDAGPIAVCFAAAPHEIGARVAVRARLDEAGHPVLEIAC
jgi:uncharacterized OB-fold protein